MAFRPRSLTRIAAAGAIALVASLATVASASAAGDEQWGCASNQHWVGNPQTETGQCVADPVVETPAPVDACPDEALNPGIQAAGPCNVAAPTVPDEAFVDPAVDPDRDAGSLAYGANTIPDDGDVSPEVAVRGAADAHAAASGGGAAASFHGELPYTGWSLGTTLAIALSLLLAGIAAHLHASRRVRRGAAA
jgi:hypothetical protein